MNNLYRVRNTSSSRYVTAPTGLRAKEVFFESSPMRNFDNVEVSADLTADFLERGVANIRELLEAEVEGWCAVLHDPSQEPEFHVITVEGEKLTPPYIS